MNDIDENANIICKSISFNILPLLRFASTFVAFCHWPENEFRAAVCVVHTFLKTVLADFH